MRDDRYASPEELGVPTRGDGVYRFVIVTLDAHAAGPAARVAPALAKDFPGIEVSIHAAAEWAENPVALARAKAAIRAADIVVANLLFIEEHITAVIEDLRAVRDGLDAFVGVIADPQIVKMTRMGELDMSKPASAAMQLLKKLRGSNAPSGSSGEKQMKMLRRLPKILRFLPGKAQDLRAWFLSMQYWLGGSDDNIEQMIRYLVSRYSANRDWKAVSAKPPVDYPDVGLYHPDLAARITTNVADLPRPVGAVSTVGLLMLRSYILASDTAHYDAVIRAFEAKGIAVLPAFAGGLDGRPAIDAFFKGRTDAMVSLTGFSLVGGPAYNDSPAAVAALEELDIPYIAAHPLEFQTLGQWGASGGGLGPVETTMLIALPEIDGATNPTVFAGRHDLNGCAGCKLNCRAASEEAITTRAMAPCFERIDALADKTARLTALRRSQVAERKVAVVLYGFPPNAGAAGTAAYLGVFESLFNTLHAMAAEGYDLTPPATLDDLREAVMGGTSRMYGQPANVHTIIPAAEMVAKTRWLSDVERVWGPAPGRLQTDGRGVMILGAQFGKVFVGLQPVFGYEGDPMRLLFEKGFAPTHAMMTFYRWLRDDFRADVLLHFGMHGALEFLPGKQAGVSETCWPDRLIGNMPNVYLYASNNPSEATLAKRRSNAVTITHLTPPLAQSGLYKGLQDLKDSLSRWRAASDDAPDRADLWELIVEQSRAVDLDPTDPAQLWVKLLETEGALIPDGLHVLGRPMGPNERRDYIDLIGATGAEAEALDAKLQAQTEIPAILRALGGHFTSPVPGGDLIRSTDILPTGRNIHAFDPFRMPTAFALKDGTCQAQRLLDTHPTLPRTVALVLWGSDNIKSDGAPLSQALALMGAKPRFDHYGRLCGADLIPLAELGRPRIDVVMTLSGIFRDLLPLQTRMLAEAAWKAAVAEEPISQNFIRAHALAYADEMGVDMETAALRVFSNAEGAYGSNVNIMVGSSAFGEEDELADAYENRKSFAYGRNGKATQNAALLQKTLKDVDLAYQNLESVELGVTTVDQYFDTLGGIARAVKRARGGQETPVYIGDQTRGGGTVRTLKDQIALETRSRSLNPKYFEGLLRHGAEGVRQIEAQVSNTFGWSATTAQVDPWVYQRLSETFVLDEAMRRRLAALNPEASSRMAQRLLEASDRNYWQPDADTLAALQRAADELEDRLEGIAAE
ncbi:magnesium chelatase subunit H [Rhodobacter sp. HX-7-19]|uniref:magnesium chelatase n=1 Tax=Paragemmobacter kunshanensis TaxID=2583234 RepID=A0A6M1U8N6_9RHOB|nr:magnesium chelatase subunit H [Rhodobacter kunshanensis]NGQ91663.1 magnesium chelatase subunit H [Rhodobacter kunshanensis]